MLTLILSLLGGGGAIGALLFFVPGLRAALSGILAAVPPKVWAVIAALAVLGGLFWWHGHAVDAAREEGRAAGRAAADLEWKTAFDKQREASRQWRTNFEAAQGALSQALEESYEADLRTNAARADALRLSGPGRASAARCGPSPHSGVAAGTGGYEQTAPGPDAPGPGMPENDRYAIVPWPWLVQRAEEFDALRAENLTWRRWNDQQRALHNEAVRKLRAQMPEPEFGK